MRGMPTWRDRYVLQGMCETRDFAVQPGVQHCLYGWYRDDKDNFSIFPKVFCLFVVTVTVAVYISVLLNSTEIGWSKHNC